MTGMDIVNPRLERPTNTSQDFDEPLHQRGNRMKAPLILIAICAGTFALGACDKTPAGIPTPIVKPTQTEVGAAPASASAGDTSVPDAGTVLPPTNATKADPAQGRSNKSMTAAQESTAMPMPGQNNDHSAELAPAKRASAP